MNDFKPVLGSKPIEGPLIRLLMCLVCETLEAVSYTHLRAHETG
jgi:hypothetical protein